MTNEKPKKTRLFFIDNLRILLIILVLLWHLAITYGASGEWPYHEVGRPDDLTSLVFMLFGAVSGPFVMGFWFMIAGYFTPGSYDRRGFVRFLRDRLLRLGIPVLIYVFFFDPLIYYAINVNAWGFNGDFGNIWGVKGTFWKYLVRHVNGYSSHGIGIGPLWFVEILLIFTLGYGLWRLLADLVKSTPSPPQRQGNVPSSAAVAIFALLLGVATFIVRIRPVSWGFKLLFVPFPSLVQYISLFVVGIMAYRRNWLLGISDVMGKFWLRMAIIFIVVIFPIVFVLGGALEGNTSRFTGGLYWQSLATAVWEQFVCLGMVIGLLVWFRRNLNRQGRLARAMSASSYAVYFIHAPVLVLLALALRGISLHPLLKWALIAPVGVSLCFLIAHLIRRLPLVRSIL
jgi:glucan biosynthesis protein C